MTDYLLLIANAQVVPRCKKEYQRSYFSSLRPSSSSLPLLLRRSPPSAARWVTGGPPTAAAIFNQKSAIFDPAESAVVGGYPELSVRSLRTSPPLHYQAKLTPAEVIDIQTDI